MAGTGRLRSASLLRTARRRWARRHQALWGYLLIAPMMIGYGVFVVAALVASFGLSLTNWSVLRPPKWVGLDNYATLLHDEAFREALKNTLGIAVLSVGLRIAVALALALALNSQIRFRSFYRAVFFMPVLTMPVATATIWKWLYDPSYGPVNYGLTKLGLPRVSWLANPESALFAVVVVMLWSGVGYDIVIFLAGLQNIPREYYDAAQIDGAGAWQQFRDVTLPLLTPTTFFLVVISVISALQVFDAVYVMTRFAGNNRLPTVVYYVYEEAFVNFRMGYGITVAWVLLAMILALTLLQFRLQRRWVHYA